MKKNVLKLMLAEVAVLCAVGLSACGAKEKNQAGNDNSLKNPVSDVVEEVTDLRADKYDNNIRSSVSDLSLRYYHSDIFGRELLYSAHDEHFWYDVYENSVEVMYLGGLGETVEYPYEYDNKPVRGVGMTYDLRSSEEVSVDKEAIAQVKEVVLPKTLWVIGTEAFAGYTSLKEINIPENVAVVAGNSFEECDTLTEITLPESVQCVGSWIIYCCDNVKAVYAKNKYMDVANDTFRGAPAGVDDFTYID